MEKYNLSNNALIKSLIIDKKLLKILINLNHTVNGTDGTIVLVH